MIQSVNTLLNDPAATTAAPKRGDAMGKDAFLTMLVAQLKNQDPLSPMKGDEMAAQLAQFSSLEQLTEIRDALVGQADAQSAMLSMLNGTAALNVLGKTVIASVPHLSVTDAGAAPIDVEVEAKGGTATLRVYDASGDEVKVAELGTVPGGKQTLDLRGALEGLPEGSYTYALDVVDSAGTQIGARPLTKVRVDGVRYDENGPVLTAGGLSIPIGKIVEVIE